MSINVAKLELAMVQKINNASSEYELLTYQKVLEQLRTGSVNTVRTFSSLPTYSENIGQLYFIEDEDTVYWANASVGWVTLQSQSLSILYQWGCNNVLQQLCNYSITPTSSPAAYYDEYNWLDIKSDSGSFGAIKTDGTLWSWGCALCGSMGNECLTTICYSSPVQEITSSVNWCHITVSKVGRNAIKTDGTLWSWGEERMLGVGDSLKRSSPTQEFCSATNWCEVSTRTAISASGAASAAIKTDGTLWVWGAVQNSAAWNFPIYDNITKSPVQEVSLSTNWSKLDSSLAVNSGLKSDGTIWSWGYGATGNLGNNSTSISNASSPIQEITSSTDWCDLNYASGIKIDGTLWSWGYGATGGYNTTANQSSPVQEITSSTNWTCFVRDFSTSRGIKTDGTLWAWGSNACGNLGDDTLISRSSPVQEITSSTNWCASNPGITSSAIQYVTL